jgi:predicted metalloprotease
MKWEDYRMSENVDDRRGGGGGYGGGGGTGVGVSGGGLGIGTLVVLGLLGWALGVDPRLLISGAEMMGAGRGPSSSYSEPQRQSRPAGPPADDMGRFVSAVVAMNEDVWKDVLPQQTGVRWQAPKLVMFSGVTNSACGTAQSAMGPFYCPRDKQVYLDTSFFREMQRNLGGGGEFAYAYVIAHEVGHHIENLLGILPRVQQAQQAAGSKAEANNLSVRVELMADCLAGVWAFHANQRAKILEPGDVERAIRTAQAIGDDKLQQAAGGRVVPDSFTHGSAAQRAEWLNRGLKTGRVDSCNTFASQRRT